MRSFSRRDLLWRSIRCRAKPRGLMRSGDTYHDHIGKESRLHWIPRPYRLDRSTCRQVGPSTGMAGGHSSSVHLLPSSFSLFESQTLRRLRSPANLLTSQAYPVNQGARQPTPHYEVGSIKLGRFRNRSARPTRIAIGSRRMRISGLSPLVAWTATQSPSSKGSETIAKRSPYSFMCIDAVNPRSLIFKQLSWAFFTVFDRSLPVSHMVSFASRRVVLYSPTAFSARPIHFCTLPASFSAFPETSRLVSFVAFPIFSLIFPLNFVKLALGPVLRTRFHYLFLSSSSTAMRLLFFQQLWVPGPVPQTESDNESSLF